MEFDECEEKVLPLRADLPSGYEEGRDILKVFATVGTTDFRWLQLPRLDDSIRSGTRSCPPANPLEELLSAVAASQPSTHRLAPAAHPGREWVTNQVELRIQR